MSKYLTAPVPTPKMPKGIPYIIGNEAAERFSFYGMKAILVVFMTQYLFLLPGSIATEPMPGPLAIEKNHLFVALVYFTPILGALISDILLGKYLTIILLSIVYCLGHGVLATMGMSSGIDPSFLLGIGLMLIAFGAGGIKPCVSAHVGDQFGKTNGHLLSKVFGWFYFAINTGAFLSTLMTPWFLEWYGPHLAFGVPGVLMAIATFFFWLGRKSFIHVPAGGMSWFKETFSGTGIRAIAKLAVIYIFVAVFWALFDQTSSSWVLQAEDMDRRWLGITWLSSQIGAVNPIMILTFIPLFQFVVYPLVNRVFTLTPIRKISIGLFVMVFGFAMVSVVQQWIDAGQSPSIGWQIVAYAILTASEVMVSITCLEFSYTQAPRTMKSLIMALFLMSVSLGSIFTAGVNHSIIVEDHLAPAKTLVTNFAELQTKHIAGTLSAEDYAQGKTDLAADAGIVYEPNTDGGFDLVLDPFEAAIGESDIRLGYGPSLDRVSMTMSEVDVLKKAIDRIGVAWASDGHLPLTETGVAMTSTLTDSWGNPVTYLLINRHHFEVISQGPDDIFLTPDDVRAYVTVESRTNDEHKQAARDAESVDALASLHPAENWITRRKNEIAAARGETDSESSEIDGDGVTDDASPDGFAYAVRWEIGGGNKLSGASYFWFFTWVMFGTACLFIIVALLYKPRVYLQEEQKAKAA